MSFHPFDVSPSMESSSFGTMDESLPPLYETMVEEPLSTLEEEPQQQQQQPFPWRPQSPSPDNIVRTASPMGRRYLKPVNGIQIKGFARSAQRRSSVLTLGSIERLQHFYAKKDLVVNKVGTLGFKYTEEVDPIDEQPPTPQQPPPSWKELDVETDLDVLLQLCFQDIQQTLVAWAMVTGPRMSLSDHSTDSDTSDGANANTTLQILPLLQSVAKMISSVKTYTVYRHDLSNHALTQLRHASLSLLSVMKDLESLYRLDEADEHHRTGEPLDDHGYLYRASDFHHLDSERQAIHHYLSTVEKYALNPSHHFGAPPTAFTDEIKALMVKTASGPPSPIEEEPNNASLTKTNNTSLPIWLERGSFLNDDIGRYHALLMDHCAENITPPDPHEDVDLFWHSLADGNILCHAYNSIVKRSKRPFGFINKIHEDTKRTYRAVENLRFFAAACKFRFELVLDPFDPTLIARKTDEGLSMLETVVCVFGKTVIQELRHSMEAPLDKQLDQALDLNKQ